MTKEDIRMISKKLGLPTWSKPALACLSSRFPYGTSITVEKLEMVDAAENMLKDEGFKVFRCRHYGDTVRIELDEHEMPLLLESERRLRIVRVLKALGYKFVYPDARDGIRDTLRWYKENGWI